MNGIAFYNASNVTVEGCIAAHNGDQQPSWSSGVNIFGAGGQNVIRGNVSFENIDISINHSDGSGFILDEGSTHGLFENNLAFLNGGSCIRLTRSSGGQLVNNTCVLNGQDASANYTDEIYASDTESTSGAALINNVALPSSGNSAVGGSTISSTSNNLWLTAGSTSPFVSVSGNWDLHLATTASQLIDQGTGTNAPSTDIGFDWGCITTASGLAHWWQYAPNYTYIESAGGVAGCFTPGSRPVGSAVDIGAYESGTAATGCTEDGQCDDGAICTNDTCAGGQCSHLAIDECCMTDADCVDDDECTQDGCDTETNVCYHPVDPECGRDPSGEWSVDETTGYVWVCDWGGYAWTASGPADPGVNGTTSTIEETGLLCYAGVVAAYDDYSGYAMLGVNISQEPGTDTVAENIAPVGDGLNISVTNNTNATLRIQIQDDLGGSDAEHRWCVQLESSGGFFAWSDFNTECWSTTSGTAYAGQPINVISVMVAGHNTNDIDFDFCLNGFSPSGTE